MLKKKTETLNKDPDEFYIPPEKQVLQEMYNTYAKMKSFYSMTNIGGSIHIVPEHLYLHSKKVLTWDKDYGWSVYEGEGDWKTNYARAKKDWDYYTKYEHTREYAIKQQELK